VALIAEYETRLTPLLGALRATPGATVDHEEMYFTAEGRLKWVFWVRGDDPEGFAAAVEDDETVASARVLARAPSGWLWSATLAGDPDDFAQRVFNERDAQVLEATHDAERTVVRVRCPSRAAFAALREAVESRYGVFHTRRLYDEERPEDGCRVTPAQREALLAALDAGYFEVPRTTTLDAIASDLGVSDQAVSSRLRRGTGSLVRDTLGRERD
jgi:predicted DNA binding protein